MVHLMLQSPPKTAEGIDFAKSYRLVAVRISVLTTIASDMIRPHAPPLYKFFSFHPTTTIFWAMSEHSCALGWHFRCSFPRWTKNCTCKSRMFLEFFHFSQFLAKIPKKKIFRQSVNFIFSLRYIFVSIISESYAWFSIDCFPVLCVVLLRVFAKLEEFELPAIRSSASPLSLH